MFNVSQKASDYLMAKSGDILKLSQIARESDIGVADELNTIASNMAAFANEILEDGRNQNEMIERRCANIIKESKRLCGIGDCEDLYGNEDTANLLDEIEAKIIKSAESIMNDKKE